MKLGPASDLDKLSPFRGRVDGWCENVKFSHERILRSYGQYGDWGWDAEFLNEVDAGEICAT